MHTVYKETVEAVMPVSNVSQFRDKGVLTPEEFVAAGALALYPFHKHAFLRLCMLWVSPSRLSSCLTFPHITLQRQIPADCAIPRSMTACSVGGAANVSTSPVCGCKIARAPAEEHKCCSFWRMSGWPPSSFLLMILRPHAQGICWWRSARHGSGCLGRVPR